MFNNILVPLDGSELASCVLPHVVAFGKAFKAKITLLRVLKCASETMTAQPIDALDWQMLKAEAEAYLDKWADHVRGAGLEADVTLIEGDPANCIIDYIATHDIDLLILSSHGESGLTGWNIGSVVQKIIVRALVSTLIVRAFQPGLADKTELSYRRLMVPLDGSQRAECVLPSALMLSQHHNAELLLAHVVRKPEMPRRTPLTQRETALVEQLVDRNRQEAEKHLQYLEASLPSSVKTRLLTSEEISLSLLELVDQEAIDLVVMSAHGYSGTSRWAYGSVTTAFIAHGTTPLLFIQDLKAEDRQLTVAEMAAQERNGH